jgi:hypothetical protein
MHPLLPAKRERFAKYFISFSVELPPITDAKITSAGDHGYGV